MIFFTYIFVNLYFVPPCILGHFEARSTLDVLNVCSAQVESTAMRAVAMDALQSDLRTVVHILYFRFWNLLKLQYWIVVIKKRNLLSLDYELYIKRQWLPTLPCSFLPVHQSSVFLWPLVLPPGRFNLLQAITFERSNINALVISISLHLQMRYININDKLLDGHF